MQIAPCWDGCESTAGPMGTAPALPLQDSTGALQSCQARPSLLCPALSVSFLPREHGEHSLQSLEGGPSSLLVPGCDRQLGSCGDPERFAVLRSLS